MARKQSDYLAGLLADDAPPSRTDDGETTPSSVVTSDSHHDRPSTRAGLSLLGRENVLSRVASGEVRQVTQLLIDPARVRVWTGNARLQTQLSEENCRDLIDSIVAEGGQKVAAVVRHISGHPIHDYELIAGTRRHFAISWLRDHSYPEMRLLAQVADLDDEAAFRLADIENRARRDISDIERARNYADAVERHYGGKAVRMAERLKLSKGWLSKMLKAAALPDAVLAAFSNWHELPLNPAYKLAAAMDDQDRAKAIVNEAKVIVAGAACPPLPGSIVLNRLMAATASSLPTSPVFRMEIAGEHGRPILTVKGINRQGVTLHLPLASGASDDQISKAVRDVLVALRQNGVSVK
jgi:ParB family chromosome partitioning protein